MGYNRGGKVKPMSGKFEIDREKFGAFVAALRKEKGFTQKELAARLFLSDKAVSKWERGLSMPDIEVLAPLAEALGVTATELLACERVPSARPLDAGHVEELVQKAIHLSEEQEAKPRRVKKAGHWLACLAAALLDLAGLLALGHTVEEMAAGLLTLEVLMAIFGGYFCLLAREKLPRYYDENKISIYSDGFFRMNMAGVHFNNRNWPHVVRAARASTLGLLVGMPVLYGAAALLAPAAPRQYLGLGLTLVGLAVVFVPLYAAAKKYE